MHKTIEQLHSSLKQGKPLVMATILSKKGSAPRSAGTRMIVHEDGSINGTIGGGWVEARVQKLAVDFFKNKKGASLQEFTLDSIAYADMDMVCGGNVTLLIEYLEATADNIEIFAKLLEMLYESRDSFMISRLGSANNDDAIELQRCIISDREQTGAFQLNEKPVDTLSKQVRLMRSPGLIEIEEGRFFVEPAQSNGTLYVLGGGHLGMETAKLAQAAGFKIIVMDDRYQFANAERFPMAKTHIIDNFTNCFKQFAIGKESYIVIMTRGHIYDRDILEQALKTDAAYIGMIGSRSKKKVIYDHLLKQGVSQERLDQVYAPIGLSIGAQTPEEIAVSIIAELIQVRAAQ
jgi:xanthine dehydrogenase accessory factor